MLLLRGGTRHSDGITSLEEKEVPPFHVYYLGIVNVFHFFVSVITLAVEIVFCQVQLKAPSYVK